MEEWHKAIRLLVITSFQLHDVLCQDIRNGLYVDASGSAQFRVFAEAVVIHETSGENLNTLQGP